jgi:hypothetical protein
VFSELLSLKDSRADESERFSFRARFLVLWQLAQRPA